MLLFADADGALHRQLPDFAADVPLLVGHGPICTGSNSEDRSTVSSGGSARWERASVCVGSETVWMLPEQSAEQLGPPVCDRLGLNLSECAVLTGAMEHAAGCVDQCRYSGALWRGPRVCIEPRAALEQSQCRDPSASALPSTAQLEGPAGWCEAEGPHMALRIGLSGTTVLFEHNRGTPLHREVLPKLHVAAECAAQTADFCSNYGIAKSGCDQLERQASDLWRCAATCLALEEIHLPSDVPSLQLPSHSVASPPTAGGGGLIARAGVPGLMHGAVSWDPWVVPGLMPQRVYFLFQHAGDARPDEQFWAYSRVGTAVRDADGEWSQVQEVAANPDAAE